MPQQHLHGAQVRAALKQVGGERMPKGVRRDGPANARLQGVFFHHLPHILPCEGAARAVDEQLVARGRKIGPAVGQVFRQHFLHHAPEQRPAGAQPGLAVGTGGVEREHRHAAVAAFRKGLAQHRGIVAGAAGAAGLRKQQRRARGVKAVVAQRQQQLSNGHNGRVAGVVVHIGLPKAHGLLTDGRQQANGVALGRDGRRHQVKVQGGHLRHQNRVRCRVALGKGGGRRGGNRLPGAFLALSAHGQQRTDADARRGQGIAFVHFYERIQLAMQWLCDVPPISSH